MPTLLAPVAIQQFKDNNGNSLIGGQLFTYQAGTSIPAPSYTDATGTSANTNPVILNSRGEAPLWLTPGQFYKLVLQDASGVLIWSADQVPGGFIDASLLPNTISSNLVRSDLALNTDATKGSNLIGFLSAGAGAVGRTLQSRLREIVSLKDFGAVGDGVANDDAAITAWLALAGTGVTLYAPAGIYLFNAAKSIAAVNNIKIRGEGRQLTQFMYNGSNLANDILTIGDGTNAFTGLNLDGFNIDSKVTMTAGTGLRIRKSQNGGNVKNISFGKLNSNKFLWDGIWFDNTNVNYYIGFEINVQNEAIPISGALTATGSDLLVDEGTITYANYGIRVSGGFGGLYVGAVNIYGSKIDGYLQDNTRVAAPNREIILSDVCVIDGSNANNVHINETVGTNAILNCNAFITGAGFFTASPGDGIYVQTMPVGRLSVGSGQVKGNKRHAMNVADATTNVLISPQTFVTDNTGWGLFTTVPLTLVKTYATYLYNAAGDIQGNVRDYLSYSTTIAPSIGSFTSANASMRYRRFGSTVQFNATINIITNGTAASSITFGLPFTAKDNAVFVGKATVISGKLLGGLVLANSNVATLTNFDNTYPGASGETLQISGSFEAY